MIKNLTIVGLALASVSAMAQTGTMSNDHMSWKNERKMKMMDDTLPISEKRQLVIQWARENLSGGDAYYFTSMLDRSPTPVDLAIVEGVFNAQRSAKMICDEKVASMYPGYTTTYTTRGYDGTVTTTTTTYAMDSWRPMRMVMDKKDMPKDIDYINGLSILTDELSATQAGILADWWSRDASIRERDVIIRLLEKSAAYADHTYYRSVYTRRATSWGN
jgi:hypothetical protein